MVCVFEMYMDFKPEFQSWSSLQWNKEQYYKKQQQKLWSINHKISLYSKTCLKQPLKNRQNIDLNDKW